MKVQYEASITKLLILIKIGLPFLNIKAGAMKGSQITLIGGVAARKPPQFSSYKSSPLVFKILERYRPVALRSNKLYVFAKMATIKLSNNRLKQITQMIIRNCPKSFNPSSFTASNMSRLKFPRDASVMVRNDSKSPQNSTSVQIKFRLAIVVNMMASKKYRIKKLMKSSNILLTILTSGPMLSLNWSITVILKMRQMTLQANRYWNGQSMFRLKLLKILILYSSSESGSSGQMSFQISL